MEEISILLTPDPSDLQQTKDQSGGLGEHRQMSNSREAIVTETVGLGTASSCLPQGLLHYQSCHLSMAFSVNNRSQITIYPQKYMT